MSNRLLGRRSRRSLARAGPPPALVAWRRFVVESLVVVTLLLAGAILALACRDAIQAVLGLLAVAAAILAVVRDGDTWLGR